MRTTLLTAAAVLTLGATAQAAERPVPVSQEALDRPVSVDVTILDADGATTDALACDWATGGPGADDKPCLRFQSDAQFAFAAIEEAGGVRAVQHTVTDISDTRIDYARRADGTWLIRSRGTVRGEALHFGRVCTADGQHCAAWDAHGAKRALRSVRAAASRL